MTNQNEAVLNLFREKFTVPLIEGDTYLGELKSCWSGKEIEQFILSEVQRAREEAFSIGENALVRMEIVASELALRQNDQEAANLAKQIIDKFDDLKKGRTEK